MEKDTAFKFSRIVSIFLDLITIEAEEFKSVEEKFSRFYEELKRFVSCVSFVLFVSFVFIVF